jgi:hypothetical protein
VTETKILVGYNVPSGEPFYLERLHHIFISGITQWAGKTTALEALISRSRLRAITFLTKQEEQEFKGHELPLYFRQRADWQYVESLISATLKEDQRFNRSFIINATRGCKTLREVWDKLKKAKSDSRSGSFLEGVYTNLDAYMEIVVPQIEKYEFSKELRLKDGLNIMNLKEMTDEMQALVIRSVVEALEKTKNIIVIIPEAWKFIGETKTPVTFVAEKLIRQGASSSVFLWIDSQNIMGVNENIRSQVGIWLLGIQRYEHEVERTIKAIPLEKKPKKTDIMNLKTGEFIICTRRDVRKVYVQPSWLPEEIAIKIAKCEVEPDSPGVQKWKESSNLPREANQGFVQSVLSAEKEEEDWSDVVYEVERVRRMMLVA